MRGAILSLLLLCGLVGQADARLFWQTYGSTVATPEGCEWNTNSDYFVPRHCDTCRYGLYSPCKKSCATSPACRRESATHPGYCSPYGCAHYCWRNHLYSCKCGCCPAPYHGPLRPACGCLCQRCWHGGVCVNGVCANNSCHGGSCSHGSCQGGGCQGGMCSGGMCYSDGPAERIAMNNDCMNDLSQSHSECGYLPNVEPAEFQILGSISLSGDPLLSSLQLGAQPVGMPMLPGQALGQTFPGQGTPGSAMPAPMPMAVPQPVPVEQPRPLFAPKDNMPAPPIVPGD
jgi:hypothetical protein